MATSNPLHVLFSCLAFEILGRPHFGNERLLEFSYFVNMGLFLLPSLRLQMDDLVLKRFFFSPPLLLPYRALILSLLELSLQSLDLLSMHSFNLKSSFFSFVIAFLLEHSLSSKWQVIA